MKIIDLHTHCNYGSKYDCPGTELHKRDFPFLMEEYKALGIIAGAFSYYSSVMSDKEIFEDNERLKQQSETEEKMYQWLVLDPRQEKLFTQIEERIHDKKVLGIKIHSPYHKYDIHEYGDKIFAFANKLQCFVLMHPDKPLEMVQYADKYPNMKLIIAHLGSMPHIEAIENAKNGNIYTDTSGSLSCQNNVVEYAVERVGSEKIFFGTDTYACGFQVGRIQYARIPDKDKENILYKNAKTHFKKQFERV